MNKLAVVLLLGLLTGAAGGYFYAQQQPAMAPMESAGTSAEKKKPLFYRNPMNPAITSLAPAKDQMGMDYVPVYAEEATAKKERKIAFYRNPMNPAITSPGPAKDEMGMDYIPVYADADADSTTKSGTVSIDPVTIQNIGVRTAIASRQSLAKEIRAVGRVAYDEKGLTRLHPKTEGWIEKLYVDETGITVEKDTILLNLYSPQLVSSQQEYLLALNSRKILADSPFDDIREGAEALVQSAHERLKLLDVPTHQIDELEQSGTIKKNLHIHSPFRGIIVDIGSREGQFVTPQTELYLMADLSRVWVYADIYEQDLPWVAVGDVATMEVTGIPGEQFEGKITYIYPYLESKSRTIKVRLEFANPGLRLKPDMYANVTIAADRRDAAIVVPSEAIVRSGSREQIFIDIGDGKFEPREVTIGIAADGLTQILNGVDEGERVVTSSQFLIDSESKLREATAKMLGVISHGDEPDSGSTTGPSPAGAMPASDVHAGHGSGKSMSTASDPEGSSMSHDDASAMKAPVKPGHQDHDSSETGAAAAGSVDMTGAGHSHGPEGASP
tara:strand:+ start:11480 stop:13150 length:1671 start_codon:yes stop_codon:yes gene_type:complete